MILAIDPGRDTGWALLGEDGSLEKCGLGDPPLVNHNVFVERPQIYRGRASKADPNDLITLAIQVGRYKERFSSLGCAVTEVLPHEWKGTVNPDVLCRRIVNSLTESECAVLFPVLEPLARVPLTDELTAGRRHNVIDAVGLAKWSRHRGPAARF